MIMIFFKYTLHVFMAAEKFCSVLNTVIGFTAFSIACFDV